MQSLSGIFSRIFLRAAIVSILLAVVARVGYYQTGNANLPWFFHITASAFLRFADTCLLFTIAFALLQLVGCKEKKHPESKSE
jgi:hypothetical protein